MGACRNMDSVLVRGDHHSGESWALDKLLKSSQALWVPAAAA